MCILGNKWRLCLPKTKKKAQLSAHSTITYFIIGNISEYFAKYKRAYEKDQHKNFFRKRVILKKRWNAKISWNDAADICKNMNSYLPYFTNRDELNEFLILIKTSLHLPIMRAVFIGLGLK